MINKAALDKVISGNKDERIYLCGKDFSLFFCYYFVDYIKYKFAPFHYEMFQDVKDLFDDKYREVVWLMFRESAKTSIAKALLLWIIAYRKRLYPNVDSFDKENAERILFDIVLEMQTNQRFISDFGELFNSKRNPDEISQKRVNNFVTNTGVRVEAHSTQESVRGRLHGHQRPDFLLLDDFETNKTKDSKAYTEQVIKHIDEFKAGLDSTHKIVYLGNYITELGSIQSLINRAKDDNRLLVRNVPVEKDGVIAWTDKYVKTDEELKLFPEKVSLEDKKKQLGSSVYSAEMLNQPIDIETQKFFKQNFREIELKEVLEMRTRKFATIDTALSRSADSDYTGICKNYVNEKNDWHLDAQQYKINPKELINIIFQLHEEGFEKIGIEETAFSEAIEPFFLDECRIRNKYPFVVPLKHGGVMKETRIEGLIPRYEAHTIYHIKGKCDILEEQLIRFPKSVHDDVMDATQYQNKIAEPPFPQQSFIQQEEEVLYPSIGI